MKKKQKVLLLIGTTVFDIIILCCLIFRNNGYDYMLEQNHLIKKESVVINDTIPIISNPEVVSSVVEEKTIPVVEEEVTRVEVYENMTIEELSEKIERSLNSDLKGKGSLIATYSIEKSVDPYLATAIMLQETGCKWDCSYLVKECNNVGGQKGNGCNGYMYFETLDLGIQGFIDNIYNNYVAYGLLTAEDMNPKYAESTTWATKVNAYIEQIRNN